MKPQDIISVTISADLANDVLGGAIVRGEKWKSSSPAVEIRDRRVTPAVMRVFYQNLAGQAVRKWLSEQGVRVDPVFKAYMLGTDHGNIDVRCAPPGKPYCSAETHHGQMPWDYRNISWMVFCGLPEHNFSDGEIVELWGWITKDQLLNREEYWPDAQKWPHWSVWKVSRDELKPMTSLLPLLGVHTVSHKAQAKDPPF